MVKSEKSRRWCFTVNNYTPDDERLMQTLPCKYIVYGNEVGENNTPHLQGFVIFEGTKTMVAMKKIHPTSHWEITKKTSETASNYCKKGEQPKEEWDKHHDDGPNFGLNWVGFEKGDFPDHQGKRTELDDFKEAVEGGMTNPRDLRKHHSVVWSRHRRFAVEYIIDHKPNVQLDQHP
jgi:Putative viral replication protein